MILSISGEGYAQLLECDYLQRLHCETALAPADKDLLDAALSGIASLDADHAWISTAWLKAAGARSQDAAWLPRFETMIDKARPYGWVSADGQSVKAHIVWNKPLKEAT